MPSRPEYQMAPLDALGIGLPMNPTEKHVSLISFIFTTIIGPFYKCSNIERRDDRLYRRDSGAAG